MKALRRYCSDNEYLLSELARMQTKRQLEDIQNELEKKGRAQERNETVYRARLEYDAKYKMDLQNQRLSLHDPFLA